MVQFFTGYVLMPHPLINNGLLNNHACQKKNRQHVHARIQSHVSNGKVTGFNRSLPQLEVIGQVHVKR